MKELELKYGCNPNQRPARIFMREGELPITVLNGKPGYINFLDALNGWDPSYGALYYYNPAVATSSWIFSRQTVVTIGKHVFAI